MKSASDLIARFGTHLNLDQAELITKAYELAKSAHAGQFRKSGEPYFTHPLETAEILISLNLGPEVVAAGLLHDVPDDTAVTLEEIESSFGVSIARMVRGVSNVSNIRLRKYSPEEFVENLRQFFLVVAADARVVYIKLADRLHNMRTLQYLASEKQLRLSRETLEVFAPLADRLGIGKIKGELEDLAFPYAYPSEYQWVKKESQKYLEEAEAVLPEINTSISTMLREVDIKFNLQQRVKHLYSLYRKLLLWDRDFSKIYDLVAVRLIVSSVADCYEVLGMVHAKWLPLPGRIKDYIARPKANGYQSLHTTVVGPHGKVFEIQIRTWEMHETAEKGLAAHWSYSEAKMSKETTLEERHKGYTTPEHKLAWVNSLLQFQQEVSNPQDFLEGLQKDILSSQIYVFTPEGDVVDLPAGATPIDFAYAIHTELGDYCAGAKINGKMCGLAEKLENGQIVEIIKGKKIAPKKDWLNFVATVAKNVISVSI